MKSMVDDLDNGFNSTVLIKKTFNDRVEDARDAEELEQLFGGLILKGQLSVLFAKTNVGKTTLAVQIAETASRGVDGFLKLETVPGGINAAFIDMETSRAGLKKKFIDENRNAKWIFSEKFFSYDRDDYIHFCNESEPNYEPYTVKSMVAFVEEIKKVTDAEFFIIDNLSVFADIDQAKAKEATKMLNELLELKNKESLTILIIAHTPKIPDETPIELNHLAGSAQLQNLLDSVFSIGKSYKERNMRYLIQLKQRDGDPDEYNNRSVISMRYETTKYPHLEFVNLCEEKEHLLNLKEWQKDVLFILRGTAYGMQIRGLYDALIEKNKKLHESMSVEQLRQKLYNWIERPPRKGAEFIYKEGSKRDLTYYAM